MHAADGDIVIHSDLLKGWCAVDSGFFADSCVARGTASGFDSGCCHGVTVLSTQLAAEGKLWTPLVWDTYIQTGFLV